MKNTTWQKPAAVPAFAMPICAPTFGAAARTRVDAAGVTGLSVHDGTTGSDAWSPPIS